MPASPSLRLLPRAGASPAQQNQILGLIVALSVDGSRKAVGSAAANYESASKGASPNVRESYACREIARLSRESGRDVPRGSVAC